MRNFNSFIFVLTAIGLFGGEVFGEECSFRDRIWSYQGECLPAPLDHKGYPIARRNTPDGYGRLTFDSGAFYEGEWVNGAASGLGVFISNDRISVGEFKSRRTGIFSLHGQGAVLSESMEILEQGIWEDGRLSESRNISPNIFALLEPHLPIFNKRFPTAEIAEVPNASSETEELNSAEGLSVKGLSLDMDLQKIRSVIREKDFQCEPLRMPAEVTMIVGYMGGLILSPSNIFGCRSKDREIVVGYNEKVEFFIFSCQNFESCNYLLRDFSRAVLDEYDINSLDYDRLPMEGEWNTPYPIDIVVAATLAMGGIISSQMDGIVERYCGRGKGGDILCAWEFGAITLYRGALGSKDLNFD